MIINASDFQSGFYRIPTTQYTEDALTEAIETYEKAYLLCLLGVELGDLFIADLNNGVPQTQRFIDIFEPFVKEIHCKKWVSQGIKKFLLGAVYWEIMNDRNWVPTEGGNVSNKKENSELINFDNNIRIAEKRFNESKFTADAIQMFICDESETYPEYNGEHFKVKYSALI